VKEQIFGGAYEYRRCWKCPIFLYGVWLVGFPNRMNMDDDNRPAPEWAALGSQLLEGSMTELAYAEATRLLQTPGVDPALYMLFCSLPQGRICIEHHYPIGAWTVEEVRSLMQCAFMLGTYVKKSIEAAEKLW
jgi:hypothetical protein